MGSRAESIARPENTQLRVVVRGRPLHSVEKDRDDAKCCRFLPTESNELQIVTLDPISNRETIRSFHFDWCASENTSQIDFFQHCGIVEILENVVQGYLGTVFAYGQTGSGKTYSMSGLDELLDGAYRAKNTLRSNIEDDQGTDELESQDEDGCMGSHWEERLFESEYMSPASSFRNIYSGLTLAFFEDSGWYRSNLLKAQKLTFGAKKGCSFATDKCITSKQTSIAEDHYCTSNTQESCSVDGISRSVCSITNGETIPSQYQYFTDPSKGSLNQFADFCPINTGYKYGDCRLPGNLIRPLNTNLNILGETYCPNCRCTKTTLRSSDSRAWTVSARRQTGCYALSCGSNGTVTLTIPRIATSDTIDVVCDRANQVKTVPGFSGTITCPDPDVVCERECPRSCAGNGICDTATAKCTCFDGWFGEDCTSKSSKQPDAVTVHTSTRTQPNSSQTLGSLWWWALLSIALLSIS
ncbi:hypothetical protein ABG067_006515 [Albugo candida]